MAVVAMKGRRYQVNRLAIDGRERPHPAAERLAGLAQHLTDDRRMRAAVVAAAIGLRRPTAERPDPSEFEHLENAKDPAVWLGFALRWMDEHATAEEIDTAYAAAVG